MSVVHSDPFTVGAATNLDDHGDWERSLGSAGQFIIPAALDRVEVTVSGGNALYRWNGAGAPTGDQRVTVDLRPTSRNDSDDGNSYPGPAVRLDANGNGYIAQWRASPAGLTIALYRVTGDGTVFTQIATGGVVAADTTYPNAYLQAIGTNPVTLEAGDDVNGAAAVTFNDSDAARHQTGLPGIGGGDSTTGAGLSGGADPMWFDDVTIEDLTAAAATNLGGKVEGVANTPMSGGLF